MKAVVTYKVTVDINDNDLKDKSEEDIRDVVLQLADAELENKEVRGCIEFSSDMSILPVDNILGSFFVDDFNNIIYAKRWAGTKGWIYRTTMFVSEKVCTDEEFRFRFKRLGAYE